MSILLSKATLKIHSAQQAEIQMQNILATYDDSNYWNTLSSMKTNAWIHLVSKEGKRSQGVSCSVWQKRQRKGFNEWLDQLQMNKANKSRSLTQEGNSKPKYRNLTTRPIKHFKVLYLLNYVLALKSKCFFCP